ncbi:MAG: glutamate racemase [bacterium]
MYFELNQDGAIGVFDSGLGGLTVLKEIISLLPQEDIVYFGDTARVPYGNKSPDVITRFTFENIKFLLSKNIKALVIACNTATAFSLVAAKQKFDLPILGVIEPGAKAAIKSTIKNRIGIIGTEGTINSNVYSSSIKQLNPGIELYSSPCPLFVPLVEEGWLKNEVTYKTAEIYLTDMKLYDIDTLILGCTHYPLLKEVIGEVMGETVKLIDSAKETAMALKYLLESCSILKKKNDLNGNRKFYVSDVPSRFEKVGRMFLGKELEKVELVIFENK